MKTLKLHGLKRAVKATEKLCPKSGRSIAVGYDVAADEVMFKECAKNYVEWSDGVLACGFCVKKVTTDELMKCVVDTLGQNGKYLFRVDCCGRNFLAVKPF